MSIGVVAPTVGYTCARKRTGLIGTGTYFNKGDASRHADCHGGRTIGRRAITKLTCAVGSPAVDVAGACECTEMIETCRNCGKGDSCRHRDSDGSGARRRSTVAELTACIAPPTVDLTRAGKRTGAHATRHNAHKGDASRHADCHGSRTVGGRTGAESTIAVGSPTKRHTRTIEGTRMRATRTYLCKAPPTDWYRGH